MGGGGTLLFAAELSILTKLSLPIVLKSLEAIQTFWTAEWNIVWKKMDLLCLDAKLINSV